MDPSNTPVSIEQLKSQERAHRRQVDHEPPRSPTGVGARGNRVLGLSEARMDGLGELRAMGETAGAGFHFDSTSPNA